MITRKNDLKTLTNHISCECNFMKENVIQINGGITINVDMSAGADPALQTEFVKILV